MGGKKLFKGVSVFPSINFSGGGTNDYHDDPTEADGQGTYNVYKGSLIVGYNVAGGNPVEALTYFNDSVEIFQWNRSNATTNPRECFTLNLQLVQTSYRKGYESSNRFADVSISQPFAATSQTGISFDESLYFPPNGQGGALPVEIEWEACVIFNATDRSLRFKIQKYFIPGIPFYNNEPLSQIIKGIYTIY